ncbi:MAG: hypothetical protein Q7S55_03885 [Nanoarchaeota archaeon]|nr:hypothetical protein [Nanoarchaeota archaeon]
MTDFKALGYQTGEITLPGLDLTIQLNSNQYFRNDGIVSDLTTHTEKVFQQLSFPHKNEQYGPRVYGICARGKLEKEKFSTIFIRDVDIITNLLVLGHEATHALIHLGLGHRLVQALRAERFLLDPFMKYDNEEDVAHIGGILALYKADKIHYVKNLSHSSHLSSLADDLLKSYQ